MKSTIKITRIMRNIRLNMRVPFVMIFHFLPLSYAPLSDWVYSNLAKKGAVSAYTLFMVGVVM